MKEYDVVVIGGGIHGVGVAQAAAAESYSVLLLEMNQLAAGTSSKSSKLIHGGLRYLESLEFRLVRESLRERELLLKLAPDLVRRQAFYIPVYPETTRRPWQLRLGLGLYAILAGFKKSVRYRRIPRAEWDNLDGLTTNNLQHVFQYWDAQTDDAELTRAVMRSAESLGAELACPGEFQSANIDSNGCEINFADNGKETQIRTGVIINAAGPWATEAARRITPTPVTPAVDLVQGAHIELPGTITNGCYYMEAPKDKRAVFVMPWRDRTMVGTTEHHFDDDPSRVCSLETELEYLVATYQHFFPNRSTEILDSWAGLRVLPAASGSAFRRSRETQLPTDNEGRPRVVSIFGGKLTGYRATAQKVMRKIRRTLPIRKPRADTKKLTLS